MDLTLLTEEELEAHRVEVIMEKERRANLANIPMQITALADQYAHCGGTRSDLASCVEPMSDAPE